MAEKKKRLSRGQKLIQTVVHPQTGETLDVIFDTSTLRFSAGIGQTWFNDDSAKAVIDWAEQTLNERATVQWIPIIQIFVDPEHRLSHDFRNGNQKQRGEWIGNPGSMLMPNVNSIPKNTRLPQLAVPYNSVASTSPKLKKAGLACLGTSIPQL